MRELLNNISTYSILLPIITGLISVRNLYHPLKVLFLFFIFGFFTEIIVVYYSSLGKNNLWLFNIFVLIEYAALSYATVIFSGMKQLIRINYVFIFMFIFIWIYSSVRIYGLLKFNNMAFTLESILLIVLSAFTLYRMSSDVRTGIFQNPAFWFESGIFIYFSANLFVFSLADIILDQNSFIIRKAWIIHSFWNIIANLLFSIGFICTSQKQTSLRH